MPRRRRLPSISAHRNLTPMTPDGERVIEISWPDAPGQGRGEPAGCLVSLGWDASGRPTMVIYRADPQVRVRADAANIEARPVTAPAIRKMLDLSTAHLPPQWFEPGADISGMDLAQNGTQGAILWVPNDPEDSAQATDHEGDSDPAVLAILVYARRHGCDFVRFDSDADIDPNLPTFEWERRVTTCSRCGAEYTGTSCDGPGYHP